MDKRIETYITAELSTAHLDPADIETLTRMANDPEQWMVLSRKPGFFIKLYGKPESDLRGEFSIHLNAIINYFLKQNVRMIEFDQDANRVDLFPMFE